MRPPPGAQNTGGSVPPPVGNGSRREYMHVWLGLDVLMVTGKVVRFDELKGYGFVAPDTGGEDVFIHVNDLEFDKRLLGPGMVVKFEVEEGDRGLKASHVQLQEGAERHMPAPVRSASGVSPNEELCDVLSVREFVEEITEALLHAAPTATAEQVLQIRQRLIQVAHSHGWVDS